MSNRRFTLLELHTHGSIQIGPGSLRRSGEADAASDGDADEEEEGGRSSAVSALLGLLVLAGAAYAIRRYRSDDEEEEAEVRESVPLTESDDVSATAD